MSSFEEEVFKHLCSLYAVYTEKAYKLRLIRSKIHV